MTRLWFYQNLSWKITEKATSLGVFDVAGGVLEDEKRDREQCNFHLRFKIHLNYGVQNNSTTRCFRQRQVILNPDDILKAAPRPQRSASVDLEGNRDEKAND